MCGLIVVAGAHAHSTFSASGGKSSETVMAFCGRRSKLNLTNAAEVEGGVEGVKRSREKINQERYLSRFSRGSAAALMDFGGGELIRLIEAAAASSSSVYFPLPSLNRPRSPRV